MPETTVAGSIVVLTGAGISAESGLSTFRAKDGLWERHRVEDVATPEAFARNPGLVQAFYNARRRRILEADVGPNPAHLALAELEKAWTGEVLIVTQNVDDLHERAGSRKVIHMHGELLKVRCLCSGAVHRWTEDIGPETRCPCCGATETLRPHVVWFGEMPFELERIYAALAATDLFVAVGTSGVVTPAAGFVDEVRRTGRAHTVEFNLEPSAMSSLFAERTYGPASETVPGFVRRLLAQGLPGSSSLDAET